MEITREMLKDQLHVEPSTTVPTMSQSHYSILCFHLDAPLTVVQVTLAMSSRRSSGSFPSFIMWPLWTSSKIICMRIQHIVNR
jgi:hypothetical protein